MTCVGAEWCSNTQELKPVLEDLGAQFAGKVRFAMIDFDESPEFLAKYNVTAVPTLLLFRGSVCSDPIGLVCALERQERRAAIEEAILRVV